MAESRLWGTIPGAVLRRPLVSAVGAEDVPADYGEAQSAGAAA